MAETLPATGEKCTCKQMEKGALLAEEQRNHDCTSSKKASLKKKKKGSNTQATKSSESDESDSSWDLPPHKWCRQLDQIEEIVIENEASDDEPEVVELEDGDEDGEAGKENDIQIMDPKVSGYVLV